MSATDGSVIGTTIVLDNGMGRFNIVITGDGYQQAELPTFEADVQAFMTKLFATPPFDTLRGCINIYRVDVASTDSGAKDPAGGACGGTGASPNTYFDSSFCWAGLPRLLGCNSALVRTTVSAQVPNWNVILVIINSTTYGGSGGDVACFSRAANADEIGLHEMCHSAFGLADEYEYYQGCGSGEAGHDTYTGAEPAQPNVTATTDRAKLKWGWLVDAATPLPTTTNADCSQCDTQANPLLADTVGAYTGAFYNHCGAFRPQFDCKMRTLGQPFCKVCSAVIFDTINIHCAPIGDFPEPDPDRVFA